MNNAGTQLESAADRNGDLYPDYPGGVSETLEGVGADQVIRSVGLNTIYQVGSQLAPMVAAIAGIPYLLRHLGPDAFGIVTLFSTALIYFTMLDLGLGRAATRFIAQSLEAGSPDHVRRYFWGSILLLTGIGCIASVGSILFVPRLVTHYLKISPVYYHASVESFYLISIAIPLVTLTATFRGMLEAFGRFALISVVTGCSGIGLYLFPALAVMFGGGLVWVAVTYVVVRVGIALAFAIGCLRVANRPSLKPSINSEAIKKMLSFGGWLSVSNIIGCAILYGDRFLLGSCIGMAAVASYSVPMDVIGRMQILITSFCSVLFPLLSRLDHSGSARFEAIYRSAVALGLSIMTPLTIGLVLLAPYLMRFWLKSRNTPEAVFAAQVFLAGAVVQATAAIAFTALHARGRADLAAWIHMAEFPIYCAAFYWASIHYGVKGAALAWLGRVIVDCIGIILLLKFHKGDIRPVLIPELVASLVSFGILLTASLYGRTAVLAGAAVCALTWLWTWRTILDREMRAPLNRALFSWRTR